jgi:hypothetical protein
LIIVTIAFSIKNVIRTIWAILKYLPYFQAHVRQIEMRVVGIISVLLDAKFHFDRITSHLVGILSHLAGLFVVAKPVELSQGVLVDTLTYNQLVHEKDQMKETVLIYATKIEKLEHTVNWCSEYHTFPDSAIMKSHQDQLDRLRREYIDLQNYCQRIEDRHEDIKYANVIALRATIESKEVKILALENTITALEARPDTENLKAVEKRVQELQQKLDTQIQDATAADIQAGLQKEELEKIRASNKSLLLDSKAAETRAQGVASAHKKAMDKMRKEMEEVEATVIDLQYHLGQVQDDAKASKAHMIDATNEMLQELHQEVEHTRTQHQEQLGEAANFVNTANAKADELQRELDALKARHQEQFNNEVKAMTAQFESQYEEQVRAAQKGLAEAAEADFNARVKAARIELAAVVEARVKAQVDEKLMTAINEALALREVAEATYGDIPFDDDDDEFFKEFDIIAAECQQRKDARQAEATANTATATTHITPTPLSFSFGSAMDFNFCEAATTQPASTAPGMDFNFCATAATQSASTAAKMPIIFGASSTAVAPNSASDTPDVLTPQKPSTKKSQAPARKKARNGRYTEDAGFIESLNSTPGPISFVAASEASLDESTNFSSAMTTTGQRITKIPGIGEEYHPPHVVAHAKALAQAAALTALEAEKST